MSFSLRLSTETIEVDPGVATPLGIEVVHQGSEQDQFEIEIEGLDSQWLAVPVPMFAAQPGETRAEKVFFKPPRESESSAGNYPFVVRVRSLGSGESKTVQGMLVILPYHHLSMELQPKRGVYSPVTRQNAFRATVVNLGNAPHTLKLYANDAEDGCAFELSEDQITVGPGGQRSVEVDVTPTGRRLVSNSRLYAFTVSARATDNTSVNCTAQAQLEHKPLFSPGSLLIGLFLVILVGGWIALIPKPPTMEMLVVDRPQVMKGGELTIRWRASNAKMVRVALNGRHIFSSPEPVGSYTLSDVQEAGTLTAMAVRDNKESTPASTSFQITVPPEVPAPKIATFEISPRSAMTGDTLLLKYKVSNAEKLILQPLGKELLPTDSGEFQWASEQPGTVAYSLVATNGGKTTRSDPIKVSIADRSEVSVVVFRAEPKVVDLSVGKVKLVYQFTNAVRAELIVDGQNLTLDVPEGEVELDIGKPTEYTLIGYDSQGRTAVKKVRVDVKDGPRPTEPPGIGGDVSPDNPTGGAGGNG